MQRPVTVFLLAQLPSRRLGYVARRELLDRLGLETSPELRHAVAFAGQGLSIEESLVAETDQRLVEVAHEAGIELPAHDLPEWLATLARLVQPHRTTPAHDAAWAAGEAARDVGVSAALAALVGYLRCAAPDHRLLREEAERYAEALREAFVRLWGHLVDAGVTPASARLEQSLARDLTPTTAQGYGLLNVLSREVDQFVADTVRQLDHAYPPVYVETHPDASLPLLALGARDIRYAGGTPREATVDAETFLTRGAELFAAAPLTGLRIRQAKGRVADVVRSPLLATLDMLDLDAQGVTDDDIFALAASPHAARLLRLDLRFNPLSAAGIEAIAASRYLKRLDLVTFDGNPADPVDRQEYYDETHYHFVPTEAGRALEAKYGPIAWLRRG